MRTKHAFLSFQGMTCRLHGSLYNPMGTCSKVQSGLNSCGSTGVHCRILKFWAVYVLAVATRKDGKWSMRPSNRPAPQLWVMKVQGNNRQILQWKRLVSREGQRDVEMFWLSEGIQLQPVEQHLLGACQEAAKDCLDQPQQGKGSQQMAQIHCALRNTSGIKWSCVVKQFG